LYGRGVESHEEEAMSYELRATSCISIESIHSKKVATISIIKKEKLIFQRNQARSS